MNNLITVVCLIGAVATIALALWLERPRKKRSNHR
jgi:hypothetical protein